MDLILSIIPGGSLTAIGAALAATVVGIWRIYAAGRKAERNELKAKEAENRAKNLGRIRDAAAARPAGSVQSDPHNRDNR